MADINLHRRTVLIRESKHDQTRVVPLPTIAKGVLQTYLSLRKTQVVGPRPRRVAPDPAGAALETGIGL